MQSNIWANLQVISSYSVKTEKPEEGFLTILFMLKMRHLRSTELWDLRSAATRRGVLGTPPSGILRPVILKQGMGGGSSGSIGSG